MSRAFSHRMSLPDEGRRPGAPAAESSGKPLCYVADPDGGVRRNVTNLLTELGLEARPFNTVALLIEAALKQQPDLIFLDFGVGPSDGPGAVRALAAARVTCPVQLMSGLNPVLVERIRRDGERQGIRMLPVLYKPFRHVSITAVIDALQLRRDALGAQRLALDDVLKNNWLEIWYQPKINLRTRRLVGAEIFARARHPEHGALPSECFVSHACENDLLRLAAFVLRGAVDDWRNHLAALCPDVRLSVNMPFSTLLKLPIADIIKQAGPKAENWPGLILEITEDEIIPAISIAQGIAEKLLAHRIGISVSNCGSAYATLARLRQPPFCELKIDRSYVSGCDLDAVTAGVCETMIDLAHHLGLVAVAEGIETQSEAKTLSKMSCDLGQGYFFARPMPMRQFVDQVQKHMGQARAPA